MPFNLFKKKTEKKGVEVKERKEPQAGLAVNIPHTGIASHVLVKPLGTEKASLLAEKSQYVFEVFPKATKYQVKQAVQELYKVQVAKVNMARTHSKEVRVGRTIGKKSGLKKAIVTLKKGQTMEVLPR